jgi:hypothetical protein
MVRMWTKHELTCCEAGFKWISEDNALIILGETIGAYSLLHSLRRQFPAIRFPKLNALICPRPAPSPREELKPGRP